MEQAKHRPYQEWPKSPEHDTCMCPDYASFCDWLDGFLREIRPEDTEECKRLENVDRVTLWHLVQDASAYCAEHKKLSEPRKSVPHPADIESMQHDFFRMFQRFRQDIIGETFRGRAVRGVEVTVDTLESYPRVIIGLTLETPRPDPSMSKEDRLVNIIFDETPWYAYTLPLTPDEAMAFLSGERQIVDADLYLDDESKVS